MATGNIACIDVGSSKVCTAIANVSDGRITEILGVGLAASRGVQKGIIVDINDATMAISESIAKVEDSVPKLDRVLVGFSGKHISSTNPVVSVDMSRRDHLVGPAAVEEADGKIRALVLAENRVPVNTIKRQWFIDGVGGIRNPLQMHGSRLDLEAHMVTDDYGHMDNLKVCLERAGMGMSPGGFIANPLASGEAVLEREDKERGVILADIGAGTTGIGVFREGSIWLTSVLPVGGRQITNDIAVGLSIPFSTAEELKTKAGSLYPEDAPGGGAELIDRYKTSSEELSYIMRARVEEILRMIVSRSPYVPDVLVLTGGTANLPGIEGFAREALGLQVRIGTPRNLPQGGNALDNPACAACAGLLLWGAKREWIGGRVAMGDGLTSFFSGLGSLWRSMGSRRPRLSFGGPTTEES